MKTLSLKKSIIFLHVIVIISSIFIIARFSKIQMRVCPEKYWAQRVNEYKNNLQYYDWKLHAAKIKLLKKQTSKVFKLKKGIVKAKSLNENKQVILYEIEKKYENDIKKLENKIKEYERNKKNSLYQLQVAEKKYQGCQSHL